MKQASLHHPDKPIFEYNQITDNILIGTNQCCQTHFEKSLLELGVMADISLEKERLDNPQGVDYFVWLPTEDKTPPTMEQLKIGVENIKKFVELGIKVYVHCKNGHGRAPTLVAAYLISQGKNVDAAVKAIADKRPSIHIEDAQIERLRQYRKELLG